MQKQNIMENRHRNLQNMKIIYQLQVRCKV
jgi:hypothetical protein